MFEQPHDVITSESEDRVPPSGKCRPRTGPERDALDALLAEIVPSRSTGMAADEFRAFARELSYQPQMWEGLLAGHVASADGEHCMHEQCRRPGYGSLATRHPCSTRVVALTARAVHQARERRSAAERKAVRP